MQAKPREAKNMTESAIYYLGLKYLEDIAVLIRLYASV